MEQLTGKTQAELVQDLQGVIFKVPNCEHVSYVAADEYLSGNVRNKLTVADLAAKNDPELAVNVEALEKVIPKDLSAAEISVRLGATWIPQEDIQRFVMELLTPSSYAAGRLKDKRRRKGSGQGRAFRYFGAAENYPKGGQTVRGHRRP